MTINQVKSYQNSKYISTYKESILELLGKCAKYSVSQSVNLHTTCYIEEKTKEEIRQLLIDYVPTTKVEKIRQYKELLLDSNKFDEAYAKLFINDRNDAKPYTLVVDIDEVEEKIKQQIRIFYQNHGGNEQIIRSSETTENVNYIYHNLFSELDNWIIKNHKEQEKNPELPFKDFYCLLMTSNVFEISNKTAAGFLKNILHNYFNKYCELHEPEDVLHWRNNWNFIRTMCDDDFLILCKKISPNITSKNDSISLDQYRDLINEVGVKKIVIPLILAFGHYSLELSDVKNIFVLNKDGVHHLVSTITEDMTERAVQYVGKQIINNLGNSSTLAHLLYDIHKIVTTELNGTFEGTITDVKSTYEKEFTSNINNKRSVNEPPRIEFIGVAKIKEELL